MITEDYCDFETAKLLKEKGFIEECSKYYMPNGHNVWKYDNYHDFDISKRIECPTLQMACKWLREVHKLYIEIFVTYKNKIPHYQWRIDCLNNQDTIVDTPCCSTYEEAVEAALKYVLENLI